MSYQELKNALLTRYNLTEEWYHEKFRKCRPAPEKTVVKYILSSLVFELKLTDM